MDSNKIKFCDIKYASKNSNQGTTGTDYYNPYEIPRLNSFKYPSLTFTPDNDPYWSNYVVGAGTLNSSSLPDVDDKGTPSANSADNIFGGQKNTYLSQYGLSYDYGDPIYPDTSIMPCDLSEPFTYILNKGSCASIRLGGDILGQNLEPNFIKFRGNALIGFGGNNYSFVYNISDYSESSNNISSITVDYSKLVDFQKISKNIIQGSSQDKFDPYYIIVPPHIKYIYAYYGDADNIKPNPRNIGSINLGSLNSNDGWYRISPRNYTPDVKSVQGINSGIFALVGANSSDNIPNKVPSFILQISDDFENYQMQSCFNRSNINSNVYQVNSSIYGIDNINNSNINWKVGDGTSANNTQNYMLCPPYYKKSAGFYDENVVEPVCYKTAKMYCAKRGYPVKSLSDLRKVSISNGASKDTITSSICDMSLQDITADGDFPGLFGASELTLKANIDDIPLVESFNNLTISNGDSINKPFIKKSVYDRPEQFSSNNFVNTINDGKMDKLINNNYLEMMSNNPDYLDKRRKMLDGLEKNSKNIKVNDFSKQVNGFMDSDPEFCNISYVFIILFVVLISFAIIYTGLNITSSNTIKKNLNLEYE